MDPSTITLIKNAASPLLASIYGAINKKISNKMRTALISNSLKKIREEITYIRRVKTLMTPSQPVDLYDFYCPSDLKLDYKVIGAGSVGSNDLKKVIIVGIAGQGKSILLRYLASQELQKHKMIPIFFELRNLTSDDTVLGSFIKYLKNIGIDLDLDIFSQMCEENFTIFLDGFDELPRKDQPRIAKEISELSIRFRKLKIIITSRPSTDIEFLPGFKTLRVQDLELNNVHKILTKLLKSKEESEKVMEKLQFSSSQIAPLLVTPLFVTLFALYYSVTRTMPATKIQFYSELFKVLINYHDAITKPFFQREAKCNLNYIEYQELFCRFCFYSKDIDKLTFKYEELLSIAKNNFPKSFFEDHSESEFLSDIIDFTGLILLDGNKYNFIHKSIQEFFCALFIQSLPDTSIKKFYTACLDSEIHNKYSGELSFLNLLDTYRISKYYFLPMTIEVLGNLDEEMEPFSIKKFKKYFTNSRVNIDMNFVIEFEGFDIWRASDYKRLSEKIAIAESNIFDKKFPDCITDVQSFGHFCFSEGCKYELLSEDPPKISVAIEDIPDKYISNVEAKAILEQIEEKWLPIASKIMKVISEEESKLDMSSLRSFSVDTLVK